MAQSVLQTAAFDPKLSINRSSTYFNDFYSYVTATEGVTTAPAGSGSVALTAGNDSITLTTAATQNDFEGVRTTQAAFNFVAGRGEYAEAYVTYTNHAGSDGIFAFGFASSATLGITVANGAPTVACSALLYKASGSAVWSAAVSCNSVVQTATSTNTAVDGSYLLRVDVVNFDGPGLKMGVTFSVNGAQLRDSNNNAIILSVPIASSAAMYGVLQTGAGTANAQALVADYVCFGKARLLTY